jgi:hypothetical protein
MVEKVIGTQLSQSTLREVRSSIYKINPIILNRWSPRSMSYEKLSYEELMSLFAIAPKYLRLLKIIWPVPEIAGAGFDILV